MATGGGLDFSPECTHTCGSVWVPPAGPELAGGARGRRVGARCDAQAASARAAGLGEVGLCVQPRSPQQRPQALVQPGGG